MKIHGANYLFAIGAIHNPFIVQTTIFLPIRISFYKKILSLIRTMVHFHNCTIKTVYYR